MLAAPSQLYRSGIENTNNNICYYLPIIIALISAGTKSIEEASRDGGEWHTRRLIAQKITAVTYVGAHFVLQLSGQMFSFAVNQSWQKKKKKTKKRKSTSELSKYVRAYNAVFSLSSNCRHISDRTGYVFDEAWRAETYVAHVWVLPELGLVMWRGMRRRQKCIQRLALGIAWMSTISPPFQG